MKYFNQETVSNVKEEVDDVAVLHHVFLALAAHQTLGLGGGHGAAGLHVLEGDDLCPNEAPLEVGVNFARGLGSLGSLAYGPGPALITARGKEGDEAQQFVGAADQAAQAALLQAQLLH